ncbi:VMAP-C domain-containing protein [Streptomyces spongiae]|uniref:Trypsin-like peptidase domain-containing protein n=1 Tax=Streptomyces spongiae TaxID=565072 RepID=A0A5N8XWA2_9ACTN|nr:trypsin-like peptidase domain-containing protein [Streptomyces spongiae]MPY63348.1 trypsin-like peptidase domain-containing protein [Streptomyces spongiae]
MTASELEDLARGATVRLGPDDESDNLWGSGFFVAPGWVLSCAHVLLLGEEGARTGTLRVRGEHGAARARAAYWLGSGRDTEQDLVLIRLLDDVRHPCVRLSDRYDRAHDITALGWRVRAGGPDKWSGRCLVNGTAGDYGVTLGPETEIPHGASGGPVLDRVHGVVAGVVKARRRAADGGLAIAVTALRGFTGALPLEGEADELGPDPYRALIRAHDQWHHQQREARPTRRTCWVAAQEKLIGAREREWSPYDAATACALLADLPAPDGTDTLKDLIEAVLDVEPHWRGAPPPRDWRDGHGWLYDRGERSEIAFLHYLLLVARRCAPETPETAAALEEWLRERLEELPDATRGLLKSRSTRGTATLRAPSPSPVTVHTDVPDADRDAPVVAVELEPDAFRPADRFHWRIWTWSGGPDTVRSWAEGNNAEGVSLAALPYELSAPLAEAFGQLDSERCRARLELALPLEHFDVNVDLWRAQPAVRSYRPHPAERPFGAHRQVVLRSLRRTGGPAAQEWHDRWHGVTRGGLEALPLPSLAHTGQALATACDAAVPVLCRTAAESVDPLREVISAGYGIVLWARNTQHTYGCGKQCQELHDHTAKLLRHTGRATHLPEELRRLRERIGELDTAAEWAEPLALLYDDPGRPLPLCDEPVNSP